MVGLSAILGYGANSDFNIPYIMVPLKVPSTSTGLPGATGIQ